LRQEAPGPWTDTPQGWFRGDYPTQAPAHIDGRRPGDIRNDGPVPVSMESFRQPSVHAAWPAEPTVTNHEVRTPVTHPHQPRQPQGGRGRPRRHRTRNVVIGLLIVVVGLAGAAGIAYKLSHRNDRTLPPVNVTTTVPAGGVQNPAQTVREYFAAINHRRYLEAWRLGGEREPYSVFRKGYVGTAHDTVTILSVSGNIVTARLAALQANGTLKKYQGTYTVRNGMITATNVQQIN
jgi:hypothetical protein